MPRRRVEVFSAEEVMERLRKAMEEPRTEPAVWDKSLDRSLLSED
jgi:hypothetical protein